MKIELVNLEGKKYRIEYIYNKDVDMVTKLVIYDKKKNERIEYEYKLSEDNGIVIKRKNDYVIDIEIWKDERPLFTLIHEAIFFNYRNSEKYIFLPLLIWFHLYDDDGNKVSKDQIADRIAETILS